MAEGKEDDQVFTAADRIRQLNDVDRDIVKLIQSAGLAVQALTNARSGDTSVSTVKSTDTPLEIHKKRFQETTSQYFALLSSIDVRLRRQVYALEEAEILAPGSISRANDIPGAMGSSISALANSLDISWLNSRKDTVGKDKEAELWAAAREFVERNKKQSDDGLQPGDMSDKMEVD